MIPCCYALVSNKEAVRLSIHKYGIIFSCMYRNQIARFNHTSNFVPFTFLHILRGKGSMTAIVNAEHAFGMRNNYWKFYTACDAVHSFIIQTMQELSCAHGITAIHHCSCKRNQNGCISLTVNILWNKIIWECQFDIANIGCRLRWVLSIFCWSSSVYAIVLYKLLVA